jgi:hypothetical protein
MAIKIHPEICNHCNSHFLIDADCGGDYYPKVGLMWWCPECGQMKPFLQFELLISKREKKKIADKVAIKYNLPPKECKYLARNVATSDKLEFFYEFTQTLNNFFKMKINHKEIKAL